MTNSKGKKRHVNGKELSQALKTNDALFVDFLNRCLEWVWRIIFVYKVREFSNYIDVIRFLTYCVRVTKCLPDKVCRTPSGERLVKIPQLTKHKSSTREVRGKVNKWYLRVAVPQLVNTKLPAKFCSCSNAVVQAIFISNLDYERLRTSVVKEHIMHAWSAFVLSLLIEERILHASCFFGWPRKKGGLCRRHVCYLICISFGLLNKPSLIPRIYRGSPPRNQL